ncbi:11415_t:CDS:1, partial [Diversispora eburnea]
MSEYSGFPSIRDTLKTIFSKASDEEISKYERQLEKVKILDPVVIINPNPDWIHQHGLLAYHTVMDKFATEGLHNNRRDENSRCIFHFTSVTEMYTVRDKIHDDFPNAFMHSRSIQALIPNAQLHPIGTAWILMNVEDLEELKCDFGKDNNFFLRTVEKNSSYIN